ncbi:DUF2461 domain-containing protein [Cycloclasticus pugetii]|uniref:Uncharacterized protein orf7 n=1 Tax=Cycloclasticus sp. A5 TaxID=187091 RepID=Q7WU96_9GAMM|nr:DUF2461 domain-containing protein [Cycloclasticus pugetii]BAC81545.1 hypothetical protein [Cycloclasticus sp. A5]SHJ67344.1 TIGR02453 family protein [Cycloclasticus pugetii]|tara:strand:+ start:69 stop:755 length:687 start_codon:yes stop_codon:yes gene_type:complete
MNTSFFNHQTLSFLQQLSNNNNRPWFNERKSLYEQSVREPSLAFIEAMEPSIKSLSPNFTAVAKKTGGSLMRIYRDARFSSDKTPYKTNIGIQFRHTAGKDVHAPGFYLHISPDTCFVGAGIWRPNSKALSNIREMISDSPNAWKNITRHNTFKRYYTLSGDSLKTYPRGYAKDHPMINDLKRKDFIAIHPLTHEEILSPNLTKTIHHRFKVASDLMDYLCNALELPY